MENEIIQQFIKHPKTVSSVHHPRTMWDLFNRYKTSVIYPDGEIGNFGYSSMDYTKAVILFKDMRGKEILSVGNYCEGAKFSIISGGEHYNKDVINHTLTNLSYMQFLLSNKNIKRGCFSKGRITIGSNVTISMDAQLLSGITIGHGAVIGAGAVVTKDVPPFAIVGGNPAKVIKYRFDEKTIEALLKLRWWDFGQETIVNYYEDIAAIPQKGLGKLADIPSTAYDDPSKDCSIVFRQSEKAELSFVGANIKGNFMPKEKLPLAFQVYMNQIGAKYGNEIYVVDNIFTLSGLI